MPSITIVEADLADPCHGRAVVELIDDYARGPMGGGTPLSDEVRQRLIPELQNQANRLILLALADGEPVGIAVCFVGFSTFAARPRLNIHDLAVRSGHQRQGIGRRLLAEIERRARTLGCCGVTLEVFAKNAVARRLYREQGFYGDDLPTANAPSETTFFLTKKF